MSAVNAELFKVIRRAIENGKLAVFIGSAVSYDSKLPSWKELIETMKGALEYQRTDDYLKIAEHYYLQYGRNTYFNKISEFFPEESAPNELHRLILSLNPQHIITTNWDDLLEKAIMDRGDLYFTVAADHELAVSPRSQLLIKMHGDLRHRNIVFKESDYHSYSDSFPLIENFIKSLFSTHVVLFIGYSISDYNLNQILSWVRNRTNDAPPAFTILTEDKITLSESNYLRGKGVYPILSNGASHHEGLSSRSSSVASLLEEIVNPEEKGRVDIIGEIATDILHWAAVYPSTLVQLVRDRFNLSEVNKIYYDPASSAIVYVLDSEELTYDRGIYRRLRAFLKRIMKHVPIAELHLQWPNRHVIRLKSGLSSSLEDEYSTFSFEEISLRASSGRVGFDGDPDKAFQFAFDNYFLKRLDVARDVFLHVANQYFTKSLFIKALISAFNKKFLCFGDIPWRLDDFIQCTMDEQLSRNDNISSLLDRFPKGMLERQRSLYQGLDVNGTFMLERFREIARVGRVIDKEIDSVSRGSLVLSSNVESMYGRLYAFVFFVLKNKIAVLHHGDYRDTCRVAFEAIVKRQALDGRVQLDGLLAYVALSAYAEDELSRFLSQLKEGLVTGEKSSVEFELKDSAFEFVVRASQNSLSAIVGLANEPAVEYATKVWRSAFCLLAEVKLGQEQIERIESQCVKAFDAKRWFDLSPAVNKFLVSQANRGISFNPHTLKSLLSRQMEMLSVSNGIPPQENGVLFSNVLSMISQPNTTGDFSGCYDDIFEGFLARVSTFDLIGRIRAAGAFVLVIYQFAGSTLREKISGILRDTFSEAKETGFNESSIVYGLNLYSLGVIDSRELNGLLDSLRTIVSGYVERRQASSVFVTIDRQLSKFDKQDLAGYEDVVAEVEKLSARMRERFKL